MYTTTTICQITQNSKTILIAEFSVFALIPQQRKNQTNSLNQLLIITEGNIHRDYASCSARSASCSLCIKK